MSRYYTEAARKSETYALTDVEVYELTAADIASDSMVDEEGTPLEPGWFYAYGSPGCLFDSEPSGPYASEEEALTAAREAAGMCPHGVADDGDAACEECPPPELWAITDGAGRYVVGPVMVYGGTGKASVSCYGNEASAAAALERLRSWHDCYQGFSVARLSDADARAWGRS